MKRDRLVLESNTFAVCAEQSRRVSAADKSARQRLESVRRRLLRSLIRVCQTLTTDELTKLANHVLSITA